VKVKILRAASEDLQEGYRFYEGQSSGVGNYFIDSLFSDIDSLVLNGESTRSTGQPIAACFQCDFRTPSSIGLRGSW
jgi:hypothetical protein